MNRPGIRISRQGAYGLVLMIAAALVLGVAAWLPYYWHSTILDDTDTAKTELRFIEARINASKADSRPHLSAGDDIAPLFLSGGTAGLALADLQARIATMASQSHITVVRSQPLQTDRQAGLAVLRAEVEATGGIDGLRDFLIALEAREPLIFVNQAQIIAPNLDKTQTAALPSENLTAILQVEAYGWWEGTP